MRRFPTKRSLGAGALAVLMTATVACPTALAAKPVVDEAYYGTLDYYGALTEGSVVKSYFTNGNSVIQDTGSYDAVENLTDRTEPTISGDKVTFDLGSEPPRNFYFEGVTREPFDTMPFRVEISYRMNGVETDPEDMAGQTGVGEIQLDVYPNQAASEYQRNNFVMEAMTVLRDSDILSVEAEGGQLQKIGDLDMVLYAVLPGEEQHFTLRIGTEDFSFSGFTFLVQPATLAQLDMVADLRDAKDELEDSYHAITDSLDIILNSLDGLDSRLRSTARGLDQLDQARAALSAGKDQAYDEADRMLASMTALSDSLEPVVSHLQTTKTALSETTEKLNGLAQSADDLRPDLQDVKKSLGYVRDDLDDLSDMLRDAQDHADDIAATMKKLESDLDTLQSDLDKVQKNTSDLSGFLSAASKADLGGSEITIMGHTTAEVRESKKQSKGIYSACQYVYQQVKTADPEADITLPKDEDSYVDFVTTYRTQIIAVLAQQQAQTIMSSDYKELEPGSEEYQATFAAVLAECRKTYDEQLTDENIQLLATLYYYDDDELSDQLAQVDQFNKLLKLANGDIEKAKKAFKDIAGVSADLMSNLSTLMSNANGSNGLMGHSQSLIKELRLMLEDASEYDFDALTEDTAAALKSAESLIGTTDTIIEQTVDLTNTVTKYEPDAQASLDDAIVQVNAAVQLLADLNRFTTTVENLMKSADPDLDQGTQLALEGLSSTLRQMAAGLGATPSIRRANESIQTLVEDKWNEYTGEKNNALNMDSQATKVSLTSEQNQSPNSIQIVLRSQEIKVPEDQKDADDGDQQVKTTFWQRVARMFRDLAAIFTGD